MADAVSMAAPFECLRRFCVSRFCVSRFCGFAVQSLRRLTSLRASPFYACGVSMAAPFLAALFLWLRRFSLRCFKGWGCLRIIKKELKINSAPFL
jgi:hypothetical protein